MRTEADTPIDQRYLLLEGRASSGSMEWIKPGLPPTRPLNSEVIYVSFAYADLPFTKRFEVVFPKNRPQDGVRCACRVVAATQQFSKPFQEIPHGWKSVCVIEFSGDIPELVQRLPIVDGWYQNNDWACICDESAWESLKKGV